MANRIPAMEINDDEEKLLEQFRIDNKLPSKSAAIRMALGLALEPTAKAHNLKKGFSPRPWGRWQGGKQDK